MTIPQILHSFATDQQVTLVAILIAADLVFGVAAAVRTNTFELSYIAQFLKDDVLGKVLPWFALFAFSKVNAGDLLGPIDFGTLATSSFVLVTAAMGHSILMSLAGLGLPIPPQVSAVLGRGYSPSPVYPALDGDDRIVSPDAP